MNKRLYLLSAKIFSAILVTYELTYMLFYTQLVEFETGWLKLFNYSPPLPTTLGSFFLWILPHIAILVTALGYWWWINSDIFKWMAIGTSIFLMVFNLLMFASLFIAIVQIFTGYLIIRKHPKIKVKKSKEKEKSDAIIFLDKKQLLALLLLFPILIPSIPYIQNSAPKPSIRHLVYPTGDFDFRRELYQNWSLARNRSDDSQLVMTYLGYPIDEGKALSKLDDIYNDGGDFAMNYILRLLYLNNVTDVISVENRTFIENALIYGGQYWFTQNITSKGLYWTENHQIAYHTAELLAGQYFRNQTFNTYQMTGEEHIDHAEYMIDKWMDWRMRFGFSEWHSNTYLKIDMVALMNLVDFAENSTISLKAAMLIDLIAFDFANNFYKDIYATSHGRVYGNTKASTQEFRSANRDSIANAAWLLLGIGGIRNVSSPSSDVASFITSDKYVPPTILENIAQDAKNNNEHKDRNSIGINDGELYGIGYDEEDLMMWWGMAGVMAEPVIEVSLEMMEKYNLDPALIMGGSVPEILELGSKIRGVSISEYAGMIKEISQGVAMETANTYTYRTPYYQLSGLQDHQKGLNAIQEHIWQASLSNDAYVFTNAPGGINWKGGPFIGGWLPKSTFYKNLGIIQYDHEYEIGDSRIVTSTIDSVLNIFTGNRPYNHAYFPRWAFDEVSQKGKWTFGSKDGGYVALYSYHPTVWASNFELVSLGKNNCWIVEMGSVEDYASFGDFQTQILASEVVVKGLKIGFDVAYHSPSQGFTTVGWDADFVVDGNHIEIDSYKRFDNKYCQSDFNTYETIIEFEGERLTLNFLNLTRLYQD